MLVYNKIHFSVKGYVRKGKIHQGLKQYTKAQDAYQKALDIDANCQDALDGFRECMMAVNSDPEEVSCQNLLISKPFVIVLQTVVKPGENLNI